jgi:hypothetical protein
VCAAGGVLCVHSTDEGRCNENITCRFAASASQVISTIIRTATNEIIEPREDRIFHVVYESG